LRRTLLHLDSWWSGLWKRKGVGIGPGLMGAWNVGRMDRREVEIGKDRVVAQTNEGEIVRMVFKTEKAASNGVAGDQA
jgi:hypothetical protein